jgi:hypothetical protein
LFRTRRSYIDRRRGLGSFGTCRLMRRSPWPNSSQLSSKP